MIAATALMAAVLTPAAFAQAHSLIARRVSISTAISLAALVQNHILTPEDLAVLVEMEPAKFLHGLQDGTIRLVDVSGLWLRCLDRELVL